MRFFQKSSRKAADAGVFFHGEKISFKPTLNLDLDATHPAQ